jgi:hypothetical protein
MRMMARGRPLFLLRRVSCPFVVKGVGEGMLTALQQPP